MELIIKINQIFANIRNTGKVTIEHRVESDKILVANFVSPPNFAAKIVALTAQGAAAGKVFVKGIGTHKDAQGNSPRSF